MLLASKASDSTVRSRKKSNRPAKSNENSFPVLTELESYIQKAASRISARLKIADRDDLAQEARLRLLQIYPRKSEKDRSYFKRTAVNAMCDVYSEEMSAKSDAFDFNNSNEVLAISTDFALEADSLSRRIAVRKWLESLPIRLRRIYTLLYVENYTQREAAVLLGISQPRVAHYHDQLKKRGSVELRHLDC